MTARLESPQAVPVNGEVRRTAKVADWTVLAKAVLEHEHEHLPGMPGQCKTASRPVRAKRRRRHRDEAHRVAARSRCGRCVPTGRDANGNTCDEHSASRRACRRDDDQSADDGADESTPHASDTRRRGSEVPMFSGCVPAARRRAHPPRARAPPSRCAPPVRRVARSPPGSGCAARCSRRAGGSCG